MAVCMACMGCPSMPDSPQELMVLPSFLVGVPLKCMSLNMRSPGSPEAPPHQEEGLSLLKMGVWAVCWGRQERPTPHPVLPWGRHKVEPHTEPTSGALQ